MKMRNVIEAGALFLALLSCAYGQSGSKTWIQSSASDLAGNQLSGLVSLPPPAAGVRLAPPMTKTLPDHKDSLVFRSLAKDSAGNFVKAWLAGGNILAQRYSSAGVPVGGSVVVNDGPVGSEGECRAALFADGTCLVVWRDGYLPLDESDEMRGQIIRYDNVKSGSNFTINDTSNFAGNNPVALANRSDQLFWIFYPLKTPQGYRIHVQKRDKSGSKVGETVLLDTGNPTSFEGDLAVASFGGGFAVAWIGSNGIISTYMDIYLREFTSSGSPRTATVKVNDDPEPAAQYQAVLCVDADQNLLAAWADQRHAGASNGESSSCIIGQLFDPWGVRRGANILMEDVLNLYSRSPDLEFSSGQFHLSWLSWNASVWRYETMANTWKVRPDAPGTMISSVYDAGPGGTILRTITWHAEGLEHGSIRFKLRSGDLQSELQHAPWHGPLDTAGYYTRAGAEEIGASHNRGRFVQYSASLASEDGQSPVLHGMSLAYTSLDSVPPARPLALLATPGHHSVALTWGANKEADLAGYAVYRGFATGAYDSGWTVRVPAGALSFIDTAAAPGRRYVYAVSALDSCHNASPLSDEASGSPIGTLFYVAKGGGGDGSMISPFPTLAEGFGVALPGDTVVVLGGIFSEAPSIPAGVSLVGTGPQHCTITGAVSVHGGSLVKGITFSSTLRCVEGTAVISDNVFLVTAGGPGIRVDAAAAPTIIRNLITVGEVGIVDLGAQRHSIRNNIIRADDAGILTEWESSPTIVNNTIIASNIGAVKGGTSGAVLVTNNILVARGQAYSMGVDLPLQAPSVVVYNDIWASTQPAATGAGNIAGDPLFVDAGTQDYHLLPGSPARDAGDPDPLFRDANGSRNDMGAYGGSDPFPEGAPLPLVRSIVMTGVSASPGDTVSLKIRVDDPRGLRQAGFTLEFDQSLVTFVRLASGSAGVAVYSVYNSPGRLDVTLNAEGPLQIGDENLAAIFFRISVNARGGDASPVTFTTASLVDVNHLTVTLRSISSGAVAVSQYADGDRHIFVDNANAGTENGSRLHPWKSIMKALASAAADDSILVAGGEYHEQVVMKDSVHLIGSGAAATILIAPDDQPGVLFDGIRSAELRGFTMRADRNHSPAWPLILCRGSSPLVHANRFESLAAGTPGIHCYDGASPVIRDNFFNGVGVLAHASAPVLDHNVVDGPAGPGGGISCASGSTPIIERNRINGAFGNGISVNGGTAAVFNNWITCGNGMLLAIALRDLQAATVRNNIIIDGSASGTGMTIDGSSQIDIVNNTLVTHQRGIVGTSSSMRIMNNILTAAGAEALQGSPVVRSDYNDFWNNSANYNGVSPGANDFSQDPQFRDPARGDYRLAPGSACVNAGSPAVEFLDPDGSRNDVGAFGGPYADSTWYPGTSSALSFDSVTAALSDTVEIPVCGVNLSGIAGLSLTFSFDPGILRILGARAGALTRHFTVEHARLADGRESISLRNAAGIADARGEVLTIVCAIQSSHAGITVLHCDSARAVDEAMYQRDCALPKDCRIAIISAGVMPPENDALPTAFRLQQNYPNPFNPATRIEYLVPRTALITLAVYDLLGRHVTTLVNAVQPPGRHTAVWNAAGCASGVYFCRLQAPGFVQTTKLLLLR